MNQLYDSRTFSIAIAILSLSFATSACAQWIDSTDSSDHDQNSTGGTVGVAVSARPDYLGSDQGHISTMPTLEYHWASGWMIGSDRGVGYNFSKDPNLQYGLGLGLDLGRNENSSPSLAGMGSIDPKLEYGAFASYSLTRNLRASSTLRYGGGDTGQAATADFGANYSLDIAPQWRLALGLSTTWANSQYMQSYFGVTATQSQQSGHVAYSPAAGIRDGNLSLNLSYQVTPRISVSSGITATRLMGDARNSPIVTRPDSLTGALSVGYAF